MATAADDLRRLARGDLEALGTDEARAELARRAARKAEKGAAYRERADEAVQRALGDVLRMFETGDLPARVAETVIRRIESDAPMGKWSLLNQLTVLLAGTADARGRRQWEAVGRAVGKDARPIFILGPKMVTLRDRDEATGEETTRRVMRGFVGVPVYAVEDTEGDPLPEPADYAPATLPPLFGAAERLGVKVRWTHFTRDYRGYYAPGADEIALMSHDERVFFHELAHAAHQRVLEQKGRRLKGGQQASQEIVAETCAAVLCHLHGLDGYIYSGREYVAAYARATEGRDVRASVARLLGEIQATLALILEAEGGQQ